MTVTIYTEQLQVVYQHLQASVTVFIMTATSISNTPPQGGAYILLMPILLNTEWNCALPKAFVMRSAS